jgi:cytochrome P450
MSIEEVDLLAANIGEDRDPYPAYHAARAEHSVHATKHLGASVTMVYSYAEADSVLKDQERFSARINGKWMRPLLGRTILEMDGREHFVHRRLITHAFRPSIVGQWKDSLIVPTAHELIDRFQPRGRAELVREFTWQLPVRVFAKILGVPTVDHERWQRWAVALERAAVSWESGKQAAREVHEYFDSVLALRRSEPGDDLLSELVSAEIEGARLPDDVIHGFIRLLIPAGAATTYRLLGSTLLGLLASGKDQALRADKAAVHSAVDETLRWEAPVQFAAREATTDTTLAGVDIPEGMPVLVALGAANRDPARYENPDAYDVARDGPPPHIAFGDGVHRCLGEHLAKLEAGIALGILLERLPDMRLEPGDDDPHVLGYAFRSPNCVPVAF